MTLVLASVLLGLLLSKAPAVVSKLLALIDKAPEPGVVQSGTIIFILIVCIATVIIFYRTLATGETLGEKIVVTAFGAGLSAFFYIWLDEKSSNDSVLRALYFMLWFVLVIFAPLYVLQRETRKRFSQKSAHHVLQCLLAIAAGLIFCGAVQGVVPAFFESNPELARSFGPGTRALSDERFFPIKPGVFGAVACGAIVTVLAPWRADGVFRFARGMGWGLCSAALAVLLAGSYGLVFHRAGHRREAIVDAGLPWIWIFVSPAVFALLFVLSFVFIVWRDGRRGKPDWTFDGRGIAAGAIGCGLAAAIAVGPLEFGHNATVVRVFLLIGLYSLVGGLAGLALWFSSWLFAKVMPQAQEASPTGEVK